MRTLRRVAAWLLDLPVCAWSIHDDCEGTLACGSTRLVPSSDEQELFLVPLDVVSYLHFSETPVTVDHARLLWHVRNPVMVRYLGATLMRGDEARFNLKIHLSSPSWNNEDHIEEYAK